MNLLYTFTFIIVAFSSYSQDTIYSMWTPKGIVSENWEVKYNTYYIFPQKEGSPQIKIPSNQIKKVTLATGEVKENNSFKPIKGETLPVSSSSGKIEVNNIQNAQLYEKKVIEYYINLKFK